MHNDERSVADRTWKGDLESTEARRADGYASIITGVHL